MAQRTRSAARAESRASIRFSAVNGVFVAAGLAALAAGYLLLHNGSTVAAPLLLVLGYAVLIPIGIIKR